MRSPPSPELTSAAVPVISERDHAHGDGADAIVYLDLACPACAAMWPELRALPLRLCVRHFRMASKRSRSPVLHAAAEAAALQRPGAFWDMVDSIYADQGHQDDPHLWARAEALRLDLRRFEADRRSMVVAARMRADFMAGIRAGVTGTPSAFAAGKLLQGELIPGLASALAL